MATERTFETTINLGGLIIPVEAEFTVTSWGAPGGGPSMTGPGEPDEPPEFHVTRVVALDTGVDLTASCDRPSLDFYISQVYVPDPGQDPVRAILFGLRTDCAPFPGEIATCFRPYRRELWNQCGTILEGIEAEISMDADALTPPTDDDWDPRDWE